MVCSIENCNYCDVHLYIIEVLRACTRWFGPEPGSDEDDSDLEMTAISRVAEESP